MPDRHEEIKAKIQAVYAEHRGLYGYRRIKAAIRRDGQQINHKCIQRHMREMGMKSCVREIVRTCTEVSDLSGRAR